jgi:AcrR family transcriptional regulator
VSVVADPAAVEEEHTMRSAAEVRQSILDAARAEFAESGLAGARVDRIARSASASKERLYAYFSDKETLFHAVVEVDSREFFAAVPLDPLDVAEFVGSVYDHALTAPGHLRMLTWARLEGAPTGLGDEDQGPGPKLAGIGEAQRLGSVDPGWDPQDLLPLLFSLGLAWAQSPDPRAQTEDAAKLASRRAAAVEAARRIIAPAGHPA